MQSQRALKRRIRTVANTGKMAKAMKAISVSKKRRAEQSLENWTRYCKATAKALALLFEDPASETHPMISSRRENEPVILVVVSSDRGLCGAYNSRVLEKAQQTYEGLGEVSLCTLGKKAGNHFDAQDAYLLMNTEHSGSLDPHLTNRLLEILFREYDSQRAQRVLFVSPRYINTMKYTIEVRQLLPLDYELLDEVATPLPAVPPDELIVEPNYEETAQEIGKRWVRGLLNLWLSQAFAAEHSARMVAMTDAFRNCEDLYYNLNLAMNKARQWSITSEILEVVSGAEALREDMN